MSVLEIVAILLIPATAYIAGLLILLSRRLRKLNNLESGLGGAIAVMTSEISRLEKAILAARSEAQNACDALEQSLAHAREEKACWALQAKMTAESTKLLPAGKRLRRRRASRDEVENA